MSISLTGFSDLADRYELVKIGGSDYHGRSGQDEPDLGSVAIPVLDVYQFLMKAQPPWRVAMQDMLSAMAEEPSDIDLQKINRFGKFKAIKDYAGLCSGKHAYGSCQEASFLGNQEQEEDPELDAIRVKLSGTDLCNRKKCLG